MDELRFVDHLARSLREAQADLLQALVKLHVADLFLAWAAAEGAPAAMEAFVDAQLSALAPEVRQSVFERLFCAEPSQRRLLQYSGRAPLSRWVSVVTRNATISGQRTDGRTTPVDEQVLERILAASAEPELDLLKRKYSPVVSEALRAALTRLRPRDRRVLQMMMVKGLSLAKVGALFDVDKSTVWHWLEKIQVQLREDIEQHLCAAGIDPAEVSSLVRALQSQIDNGLSGLSSV
jgi:RNA polymerase sigma-70 factor (ECF subfamily)